MGPRRPDRPRRCPARADHARTRWCARQTEAPAGAFHPPFSPRRTGPTQRLCGLARTVFASTWTHSRRDARAAGSVLRGSRHGGASAITSAPGAWCLRTWCVLASLRFAARTPVEGSGGRRPWRGWLCIHDATFVLGVEPLFRCRRCLLSARQRASTLAAALRPLDGFVSRGLARHRLYAPASRCDSRVRSAIRSHRCAPRAIARPRPLPRAPWRRAR